MGCNDRPGRMEAGFRWDRREWREHGIPSRRFSPCPHCGSAVPALRQRRDRMGETLDASGRTGSCGVPAGPLRAGGVRLALHADRGHPRRVCASGEQEGKT